MMKTVLLATLRLPRMTPAPRPPTVVTLSREEMKSQALAFAKTWAGPQREEAEAKTFLDQFFAVFGRDRRSDRKLPIEAKRFVAKPHCCSRSAGPALDIASDFRDLTVAVSRLRSALAAPQ